MLSTESILATQRRGTVSSPRSSPTSLTRPRIEVVHGTTSAYPCRGICVAGEDDDRAAPDLGRLAPPDLTARAPCGGFTKRRQVTPLVRFVERVFVVRGIARLDFG
jgi:hypothetical protein